MSIDLMFGCAQIETAVRDIGANHDFMTGVFGAGKIEQQLAKEISDLFPGGEHKMEHLGCGEAVFQLNEPSVDAERFRGHPSIHQRYLDDQGPCVTNLNYYVDDAVHAHQIFTEMGAKTYIKGPSTIAPCLADYGPNTRRQEPGEFFFVGSRDLIGFDLEFMEQNFRHFTLQTAQYPAFVHPRPDVGNQVVRVLRLRTVVGDLEETYRNIVRLFTPAGRSKPYDLQAGSRDKSFRIGLGGIEIEYCQPAGDFGYLGQHLANYGPGVASVVFGCRDPKLLLENINQFSSTTTGSEGKGFQVNLPVEDAAESCLIGCRSVTGFDVELQTIDERAFNGDWLPLHTH